MSGPLPVCGTSKNFFVRNIVEPAGRKLDKHPVLHKVVIIVAHIFRMLAMLALISFLPFGLVTNCILSLSGSLFYRIAIERNCPFRFAIPACLGAMAFAFSVPHLVALIAKTTFSQFMQALTTAIPFGIYLGYIIWSANSEVNAHRKALQLMSRRPETNITGSCCGS